MSDIPFLILVFVSGISLILPFIAYMARTKFPPSFIMWVGGIIWLMLFLTNDNITFGEQNTEKTYNNATQTVELTYESADPYPIRDPDTFEPSFFGIMFIVLSLTYIMVGVLAERD